MISAINSNTQISLICALITINYYLEKRGDDQLSFLGAQLSLASSVIVVVVIIVFPVAMILSYKLKGPQNYNNCLIVGYEIDRLGLNTCIFFYVIDYFSQVLIVVLVIFLQRSSLA